MSVCALEKNQLSNLSNWAQFLRRCRPATKQQIPLSTFLQLQDPDWTLLFFFTLTSGELHKAV